MPVRTRESTSLFWFTGYPAERVGGTQNRGLCQDVDKLRPLDIMDNDMIVDTDDRREKWYQMIDAASDGSCR